MMHPEDCEACPTHNLHHTWHHLYWAIASAIAIRILDYIFRTIQKIEDNQ